MKCIKIISALLIVFSGTGSIAQQLGSGHEKLRKDLTQIIMPFKGKVGIVIVSIEDSAVIAINNNHHYPMLSVYKFPLALAVLDRVDKGTISLQQKIKITTEDLKANTWSPLRTKYPEGNIEMSIAELLDYTVSQSDNNTCDILFRFLGGTMQVNNYIHGLGISQISIAATEEEMSKSWDVQYTNWTEPLAMAKLLEGFYHGAYLSDSSTRFLMKLMVESSNSANRLKKYLPKHVVLAHKTGTSNTNKAGMAAAVNDVGIVTLPDGRHLAITVFVSDSYEKFETNEAIIADISKTTLNYFMGR
jgi:beta-lactamase class A